jgi:hypothetical protein
MKNRGMSKNKLGKKKQWQKPNLIFLGRGKAEESVLTACKGNNQPSSMNLSYNGCMKQGNCRMQSCSIITAS